MFGLEDLDSRIEMKMNNSYSSHSVEWSFILITEKLKIFKFYTIQSLFFKKNFKFHSNFDYEPNILEDFFILIHLNSEFDTGRDLNAPLFWYAIKHQSIKKITFILFFLFCFSFDSSNRSAVQQKGINNLLNEILDNHNITLFTFQASLLRMKQYLDWWPVMYDVDSSFQRF